jgi:hypothetical protein
MDQPVRRETAFMPPRYAVFMALALGIVSVVFYFATDTWYAPVIAGAVGLVLGSYSFTVVKNSPNIDDKKMLTMLAAAAMAVSVVGFMLGITMI